MRPLRFSAVVLVAAWVGLAANAQPRKHVIVDGNRTRPVHVIPLYDENGDPILPTDPFPAPFSSKTTCGDCHDYNQIGLGRHFNSSRDIDPAGRPGEPWVLADESSGIQLPVSYRGWDGAWKPGDIGMTQWDFVKTFGRHMPGGDAGEKEEDVPDPEARWEVSGKLEINCLACHNQSDQQNQSAWAIQVGRENFRWAATEASRLGVVQNMASRVPESYELINGPNLDNSYATPPEVFYNKALFDKRNAVYFDVTRDVSPSRCYYCHSTIPATLDAKNNWELDPDVHVAAGIRCTECHRNTLDHAIVRGYEGEDPSVARASLTCEGCHLGVGGKQGKDAKGGRLGAPRPRHRGFPAVHFEKLTCTACHSGPLPEMKTGKVRTARANRLGIHGRAQWDTKIPYIMAPVFVRNDADKIEPREMMWPAYWGRMKGDKVAPMPFAEATEAVAAIRDEDQQVKDEEARKKLEAEQAAKQAAEGAAAPAENSAQSDAAAGGAGGEAAAPAPEQGAEKTAAPAEGSVVKVSAGSEECKPPEAPPPPVEEEEKPLTEAQIVRVLTALAAAGADKGEPVYVSGGKVYKLSGGGLKTIDGNAAAKPYSWPFAHDVRPASQALGSGGCTDCHSDKSGFFYGLVAADSPTGVGTPVTVAMADLEHVDRALLEPIEALAALQTPVIVVGILLAVLLAAAVTHFGFMGLESILRMWVADDAKKNV